jgi:prevent-host-death family protein
MDPISVSEFKAKALSILDHVSRTGEEVILTKRGKPIAKVCAYGDLERPVLGGLEGTILYEGDIVSPLGEGDWDAAR